MTDYKCQVNGEFEGGIPWSFSWKITSSQTEGGLATTWANAWTAAWTDASHGLQTLYPTTTTFNGVSVATLDPTYHTEVSRTVSTAALAGTATGDSLPFLNSVVVSLRSNTLGKRARGRTYLPAMEETMVNNDIVTAPTVARIKAAVTAVQTAIQGDGSTIFVSSQGHPREVPPVPAGPKYVITTLLVSNKPARQSRRVRKVRATYL